MTAHACRSPRQLRSGVSLSTILSASSNDLQRRAGLPSSTAPREPRLRMATPTGSPAGTPLISRCIPLTSPLLGMRFGSGADSAGWTFSPRTRDDTRMAMPQSDYHVPGGIPWTHLDQHERTSPPSLTGRTAVPLTGVCTTNVSRICDVSTNRQRPSSAPMHAMK